MSVVRTHYVIHWAWMAGLIAVGLATPVALVLAHWPSRGSTLAALSGVEDGSTLLVHGTSQLATVTVPESIRCADGLMMSLPHWKDGRLLCVDMVNYRCEPTRWATDTRQAPDWASESFCQETRHPYLQKLLRDLEK